MQRYWAERAGACVAYAQIVAAPEAALADIATALGLAPAPGRLAAIAAELGALEAPAQGQYDPSTLLHPRHRAAPGEDVRLRAHVRDVLGRG